jgi:hypothetical protein
MRTIVTLMVPLVFAFTGCGRATVATQPPADAEPAKPSEARPANPADGGEREKAQNNLKQLGIGMFAHYDNNKFFPGDMYRVDRKTMTAWSWRVLILPYIELADLYSQLDTSKAWDDPANLKILEKMGMPKVFELPGRAAPKGHTYFRVFSLPKNATGKDRPFLVEGETGPYVGGSGGDITDGLSTTFMIVEAREAVPWYKPDVLAYDGVLPLPEFGGKASDTFLVAFADGSVKELRRDKLDEKTLRALITRQGGEAVKLP